MTKKTMFIKLIINSLIRRHSRMFIAILAISIGAMIMSGLITIYYDIPRQLGKEFRNYGVNMIIIPKNSSDTINDIEFNQIKKDIPKNKIVGIAPYRYVNTKINEHPFILAGTDMNQVKNNSPFWYVEGKWVNDKEKKQVMIGKEIAKTLNLKIGDTFHVQGIKYGSNVNKTEHSTSAEENKKRNITFNNYDEKLYVKGIITTGGIEESFIFLNIKELNDIIEDKDKYNVIECSIEANANSLNKYSDIIQKKNANLLSRPVKRVTQSQDTVLGKLQLLVYLVSIIILILTMISVTTTMMAVVRERREEIGLKKALGAINKEVIKEFLGEGIILGIIGGTIGSILGFWFAQKISLSVFGRAIQFHFIIIPITIIAFVIITVISCLIPVKNVMNIDPAIVLRGE